MKELQSLRATLSADELRSIGLDESAEYLPLTDEKSLIEEAVKDVFTDKSYHSLPDSLDDADESLPTGLVESEMWSPPVLGASPVNPDVAFALDQDADLAAKLALEDIDILIDNDGDSAVIVAQDGEDRIYWDGSTFVGTRAKAKAYQTNRDALPHTKKALAKLRELMFGESTPVESDSAVSSLIESALSRHSALPLDEAKGNPWHDHRTGKFTTKGAVNSAGHGSLSHKRLKHSKQKVKSSGKAGPKMVKTPSICGRPARTKRMNVRCWTGTPYPQGKGRTPKNLTKKGMATKRLGAGRGWRKGQTDRAVGRRIRRESEDGARGDFIVTIPVDEFIFEADLSSPHDPNWHLEVADRSAFVCKEGDVFEWAVFWEDECGEEHCYDSGYAPTVEEAWSDAAYALGYTEEELDGDLGEGKLSPSFKASIKRGDFGKPGPKVLQALVLRSKEDLGDAWRRLDKLWRASDGRDLGMVKRGLTDLGVTGADAKAVIDYFRKNMRVAAESETDFASGPKWVKESRDDADPMSRLRRLLE